MKFGNNYREPPIYLIHADLARADDSAYRSKCPVCGSGILLVMRNEDMTLSDKDFCTECAQRFIYTDIKPGRFF